MNISRKFQRGDLFYDWKSQREDRKENSDTKKTLEDGASNDRLSEIFSISKSEQTGAGAGKRLGGSIEPLYRRDTKLARPKFFSGQ